jgi:dTDP-glucose 4,6-dehydratase
MRTKVLVLGSNSFSGANFVNYALNSDCSVLGISRSQQPNDVFLPYADNSFSKDYFKFYQLNINSDLNKIISLINQEKPEYIFNFAAQSMVAESWDTPEHWMMTNVVSTTNLLNSLKDCKFIKKYVHISTPEVYGSCSGYTTENIFYNPSTPYAVSRASADMILKIFVDNYHFPAVITRAANVYGAGQQLYRIIPRTIMHIIQGKKIDLHGGGKSERSFIHINDVADATMKVALKGVIGESYHISTKSTISIKALVNLICEKMNVEFGDYVRIVEDRLGKDEAYLLDSRKIRSTLFWNDSISLQYGIDEMIFWVKNNIETLERQPNTYVHKF